MARGPGRAAGRGRACPEDFRRAIEYWLIFGWPAFLALLVVFALMVMKPAPW